MVTALLVVSVIMFGVLSVMLCTVVAFACEEFRTRHAWHAHRAPADAPWLARVMQDVDLGRLVLVWLYRLWVLLAGVTTLYLSSPVFMS